MPAVALAEDDSAIDQIREGHRAVGIEVGPNDCFGGLLRPGDRVNVLVYFEKGKGIPTTGIRVLLRHASVFAIDLEIDRDTSPGRELRKKTVTLELSERDSLAVILAQQKCKLLLQVCGPKELASVEGEDEPVTLDQIVGTKPTQSKPTSAESQPARLELR
jgi:Flp pilus assembly protein CpaB